MSQRRESGSKSRGNPEVGEGLFTVRQVAKNWQVSERMIRRMIAEGRLPLHGSVEQFASRRSC
jgi:hypothetical protein